MTGVTATQNLVYPTGGDLVEDQGKYTRDIAVALDYRILSHDADVARSKVPPFALVERTTEKDFTLGGSADTLIDFETVLEDTDGLVSLEDDARLIRLNRLGWWNIGMYARIAPTGCNPGRANFFISMSGDTLNQTHDGASGAIGFVGGSVEELVKVFDFTQTAKCRINFSGANCSSTLTVRFARMWAYWVRDL